MQLLSEESTMQEKDYKKEVANKLLSKYENSKHFLELNSTNRRVLLKMTEINKHYNDSSFYNQYRQINDAVDTLEEEGYIGINKDMQGDYVSVALILDLEKIKQLYLIANRVNKHDLLNGILEVCEEERCDVNWINTFLLETIQLLQEGHASPYLKDKEDAKDILHILKQLTKQQEEISLRKFSIQCFHDSKKLEGYLPRIESIIKHYDHEELEEDVLSSFNVLKNPGFIYLKGHIVISLNGQIIDVGKINGPFSITTENLQALEIMAIDDHHLVTIENLTSFYDLKLDDSLMIYLGGYHNSLRRSLLEKIVAFKPSLACFHFGDLDAGGMSIFHHLRTKTHIDFKPLAMNRSILETYCDYGRKLTQHDIQRLRHNDDPYFQDVIKLMLEWHIKLEQEIIDLPEDVFKHTQYF